MITFRTASTVAVGDPVTSAEMIALANAINDRIRSGMGDPTRRIHFYLSAMSREIRNPDSSGTLFPSVDEFRQDYEHVPPSEGEWPFTGPGEPEGVNVSTILGSHVFGNDALDVKAEDVRLADPMEGGVDLDFGTGSALELWELAKRQRGAADGTTGSVASPVFQAAKSHFAIIQSARSPHGNAYGGYIPTPEYLGSCIDPDEYGTFELIFTPIVSGLPTLTFRCCCASESDNVRTVLYYPSDRYEIWLNDGTVTILNWNEYIEGPYTFGNRLTKTWGNHLNRVLSSFVSGYKGTDAQYAQELSEQVPWLGQAFTTHEFLTTQYHLAPQRGTESGEFVTAEYPRWLLSGATSYAAGTAIPRSGAAGNSFATQSGFVCASVFVFGKELLGPTTVHVMDGTEVLGMLTITPDAPGSILTIRARSVAALTFTLSTGVALQTATSTSGILCEATELQEYKPALWDLALFLRLAGFRISTFNGTDGSGSDEDQAREIGEAYFANGVCVNQRLHIGMPGSFDQINQNAIFEAARKYQRQCSRLVPRGSLIGYEVGADGKSVLYFRRMWNGHSAADMFEGIAPALLPIASGALVEGRRYKVSTATVNHMGNTYAVDAEFTAGSSSEFSTSGGSVYEADGIEVDAVKGKWSNEWVLDVLSLIPYSNLDTSIYKVSAFTDYVSWSFDRCTFMHPTPLPVDLRWHFQYGASLWTSPESLPSYRYVGANGIHPLNAGINDVTCAAADTTCEAERRKKLRSCPIGELPHVIESVTRLFENGEEVIKIKLATRLQHGSDAPATVDRDYSTWTLATIQAENESGRTQENGIREYLINQYVGGDCEDSGVQYGNAAHESTVISDPAPPLGACYPRIGFIKLIPKPYEDGNTSDDPHDTPMESLVFQMSELYARCMCEGFVDTVSTESYGCATGTYSILDYTFESCCFDAFGGRSFGVIQSAATDLAPIDDVRPDKPLAHGVLPNCYASAELFNQHAQFWNKLTAVRLMLPIDFQVKSGSTTLVETTKLYTADLVDTGCTLTQVNPGVFKQCDPKMPSTPTLGAYASASFASGNYQMAIDDFSCDGSGDWNLVHSRTDQQFKWSLLHSDYLEAIPASWQDMIETNGLLLGTRETEYSIKHAVYTTATNGDSCNSLPDFWSGAGGEVVKFVESHPYVSECKLLPFSERLQAALPPRSDIGVGRVYDAGDLIYCVVNSTSDITVTPIPADGLIIRASLV